MPARPRHQQTPKAEPSAPQTATTAVPDPPLQTIEDGWNAWRQLVNVDAPNVMNYLWQIAQYAGRIT